MPLSFRGNAGMTNSGSGGQRRGGGRGPAEGRGGPGFAIYQDAPDAWLAALNRIMVFVRGWLLRIRTSVMLGVNYQNPHPHNPFYQ